MVVTALASRGAAATSLCLDCAVLLVLGMYHGMNAQLDQGPLYSHSRNLQPQPRPAGSFDGLWSAQLHAHAWANRPCASNFVAAVPSSRRDAGGAWRRALVGSPRPRGGASLPTAAC
eukprot:COSAG01_NODE_599_length_15010_cov_103.295755_2_plen_117_part_00